MDFECPLIDKDFFSYPPHRDSVVTTPTNRTNPLDDCLDQDR